MCVYTCVFVCFKRVYVLLHLQPPQAEAQHTHVIAHCILLHSIVFNSFTQHLCQQFYTIPFLTRRREGYFLSITHIQHDHTTQMIYVIRIYVYTWIHIRYMYGYTHAYILDYIYIYANIWHLRLIRLNIHDNVRRCRRISRDIQIHFCISILHRTTRKTIQYMLWLNLSSRMPVNWYYSEMV